MRVGVEGHHGEDMGREATRTMVRAWDMVQREPPHEAGAAARKRPDARRSVRSYSQIQNICLDLRANLNGSRPVSICNNISMSSIV
jgi:hypothetical protein